MAKPRDRLRPGPSRDAERSGPARGSCPPPQRRGGSSVGPGPGLADRSESRYNAKG